MKLLLGSQSPRRKELLRSLGYNFETVDIICEEIYPENIPICKVAAYLSELKANNYSDLKKDEVLLTADTVVAIENTILGKPKNNVEAKEMLALLSGKTHQVYTSVTIRRNGMALQTETDIANVEFLEISEKEIDFYIKNYKILDKAGAYAIQEWLGMTKISRIEGSFYTIMGLPTSVVYRLLNQNGVSVNY